MIMVFMGHFLLREITRQFISGSCYFYHSYFKWTDTGYAMKMENNLIMPVLLFPYFLIVAKTPFLAPQTNAFMILKSALRFSFRVFRWLCARLHNSIANELELPQSCTKPSICMVTSSNRSIFRVTCPWCREFGGHRWIPVTKANDAELWCFLWSAPEQTVEKQVQSVHYRDVIMSTITSQINYLLLTSFLKLDLYSQIRYR